MTMTTTLKTREARKLCRTTFDTSAVRNAETPPASAHDFASCQARLCQESLVGCSVRMPQRIGASEQILNGMGFQERSGLIGCGRQGYLTSDARGFPL